MPGSYIPSGASYWIDMATPVRLSVALTPVGEPWVKITAPGFYRYGQVREPTCVDLHFCTEQDQETLTIQHVNKSDLDAHTAVIVSEVSFFGISDPRFVWAGLYRPEYPKPWAQQQTQLASELPTQNYLGWNGTWQLTFGVPVFTWMHQCQGLGWIYR